MIELDEGLVSGAADPALTHGLRGHDAPHCAAALAVGDVDLVAASGDLRLLSALQAEGVAVCDTTA